MANPASIARHSHVFQKIVASPSTIFIGDLPKDVNQIELYEYLKEKTGSEVEIIIKR